MVVWPTLLPLALLTGPAGPVSRATGAPRASVRAATNLADVVADAPAGFTWVSMPARTSHPARQLLTCMPTRTGL